VLPVPGFRRTSFPPASLTICDQGFTAEIPDTYLVALQTNLQQLDSEIAYIGKADADRYIVLLLTDNGNFRTGSRGYGAAGMRKLNVIAS
jgi:hypothetical protein